MFQPIIQTRLTPWYPGQLGIAGSDNTLGLRTRSRGTVLYVDGSHPLANDASDGTNPDGPLATIQGAVTKLVTLHAISSMVGSQIIVQPGAYVENVIIPSTAPANCMLIGAGTSMLRPTLTAAVAATPALDVRRSGWEIAGFYFVGPTLAACVRLCWLLPAVADRANLTHIHDCMFDGAFAGLRGVDFYGAPGDVVIEDCTFKEFHVAGNTARAIAVTSTADSCPLECIIRRNIFAECDNFITPVGGVGSFNGSFFLDNIFTVGSMLPTFQYIDLRLGGLGRNVLKGNVFPGDYSNVGGFFDGAVPSCWVGNYAEDIAEAEVGDNGLTIAPPA